MGRAPCCEKEKVKKGPWSPEEDTRLKAYMEQHGSGGNWIALPQKLGLKRCGKSCRLRWLNYLRPNIKHGGFSEEEDNIICSLYISIGSRWSIIAAQLPGRTDNDIKNYWNTRLKKKMLGRQKDSRPRLNSGEPNGFSNPAGLSASALERMQLHMQLQNLQHPCSFYNNPALWPKVRPQGDGIASTTPNGDSISTLMQQPATSHIDPSQKEDLDNLTTSCVGPRQPSSMSGDLEQVDYGSLYEFSSSTNQSTNTNFRMLVDLKSELNDLVNSKTCCPKDQQDQIGKFNGCKEMVVPNQTMSWWANDFDAQSSTNSWESATMLETEEIFQGYLMDYDL